MDNKDNKISNKVKQNCDNKEKLKVNEQIKLQKTCTEHVKSQDSPSTSTNYEYNEEDRILQRKSTTHEKQKEVSMVSCIKKSMLSYNLGEYCNSNFSNLLF
jgi:hypothetical protein